MSVSVCETYSQALAAGVPVVLPAGGSRLVIADLSAGVPVDVEFLRGGSIIGRATGMDTGFSGGPGGVFEQVRLTSSTAQTVTVIVTDGQFSITKIAGSVTVKGAVETTPNEAATYGGSSYFFAGKKDVTTSGYYSGFRAENPAGSGKDSIITSLSLYASGSLRLGVNKAFAFSSPKTIDCQNKDLSAANAAALTVTAGEESAPVMPAADPDLVATMICGGLWLRFDMSRPILLRPGDSLTVGAISPDDNIALVADFYEKPST